MPTAEPLTSTDVPPTPAALRAIADLLGVRIWHGNTLIMDDALVAVTLTDGGHYLTLNHIVANPMGTGAGTRILHALRDHCLEHGISFTVEYVANRGFFSQFDWLAPHPLHTDDELADPDFQPHYVMVS